MVLLAGATPRTDVSTGPEQDLGQDPGLEGDGATIEASEEEVFAARRGAGPQNTEAFGELSPDAIPTGPAVDGAGSPAVTMEVRRDIPFTEVLDKVDQIQTSPGHGHQTIKVQLEEGISVTFPPRQSVAQSPGEPFPGTRSMDQFLERIEAIRRGGVPLFPDPRGSGPLGVPLDPVMDIPRIDLPSGRLTPAQVRRLIEVLSVMGDSPIDIGIGGPIHGPRPVPLPHGGLPQRDIDPGFRPRFDPTWRDVDPGFSPDFGRREPSPGIRDFIREIGGSISHPRTTDQFREAIARDEPFTLTGPSPFGGGGFEILGKDDLGRLRVLGPDGTVTVLPRGWTRSASETASNPPQFQMLPPRFGGGFGISSL